MHDPPKIRPPARRYGPGRPTGPGSRDVSSAMQHVLPLVLGFGVGMVWVVWIGFPLFAAVLIALLCWGTVQIATRGAGEIAGRYLGLRGGTTPPRREYSQAQALAVQGKYAQAIDAYEIAAAESDGDPTPYLAIARIYRDELSDFEAAVGWFRRARRDARLPPGLDMLVAHELAELFTTRLHQPQRAIPELARIVDLAPGTPQADAAARDLAALRAARQDAAGDAREDRE